MPRQTPTPDPDQPTPDPPWGTTAAEEVPGPGFAPTPDPLPGRQNPDPGPAPDAESGASASSAPAAPTRIEIPKGRGRAYAKIAKGVLDAVGGLINRAVAVDEDDTSFLPDDDDHDTIPPPLGRLAARRVPLGKAGDDFTDLEDIGQAAVGLIAWALKGVTDHLNARRERGPKGRRITGAVAAPDFGDEDQGDGGG